MDLHGYSVHEAWKIYRSATEDCYQKNIKKLQVITGHGVMHREFLNWVQADPYAVSAQRQDPNTGAWTVKIKKNTYQATVPEEKPVDLMRLYKHYNR